MLKSVLVVALMSLSALVSLAPPALAAESWLAASDWEPRPGEEVRLSSHQGTDFQGDALAWRRASVKRLLLRGDEETDLAAGTSAEAPRWPAISRDDDGTLVALETEGEIVKLRGAELDLHVADDGLRGVARARAGSTRPARERRTSCEKLWLSGDDARRVREPAGLTLELVPRRDPSRVSSVRMQLLFRGRPVTGALVKSWIQPLEEDGMPVAAQSRLGLPMRWHGLTDERGMVRLDVRTRGEYLVSAVHSVPCRDPNAADWDTWWTSLAFAHGAGPRPMPSSEPAMLRGTGLGTNPDLGDPGFERSVSRRDVPGWGRRGLRL